MVLADILSLVFLILLYYFMKNKKLQSGNNMIFTIVGFVLLSAIFFITCGLALDILLRYGLIILVGVILYYYFKKRR